MNDNQEKRIQAAKAELQLTKNGKSASRNWAVSRTTLNRRAAGFQDRVTSHAKQQRLSRFQEEYVSDWIIEEDHARRAPSKLELRSFAECLVREGGDFKPIGKNWPDAFLKRNPRVKMKMGSGLEAARSKACTPEALRQFHERLEFLCDRYNVSPTDITNVNEHGLQDGDNVTKQHKRVVGDALTNKTDVQHSSSTTWVTIIEACVASGIRLPPLIIYTGANVNAQNFPIGELPPYAYGSSVTGWSNSDLFVRWIKECYLPATRPRLLRTHRILIMDGHTTHLTVAALFILKQNNVHVILIPAHSSHVAQPEDRSIFGPLKTYYKESTKAWASYDTSAPRQKQRFLKAYHEAAQKAFSSKNIHAGFKTTGICPLNQSKLMDSFRIKHPRKSPPLTVVTPEIISDNNDEERLWVTPQSGQDLQEISRQFEKVSGDYIRNMRTICTKAGKRIDQLTIQTTIMASKIRKLEEEVRSLTPHPRKKVKLNGNDIDEDLNTIISHRDRVLAQLPLNKLKRQQRLAAGIEDDHTQAETVLGEIRELSDYENN